MSTPSERSVSKLFGRWTRILFLVASGIAIVATLIAFSGFGPVTPDSKQIVWLLAANFVLIGILAIYTARDFFKLSSDRSHARKSKLARRFATLFCLAAIIPAILVAVFLGTSFNRYIQQWFGSRLPAIVENSASVSRSNLFAVTEDIKKDVTPMISDLNGAVVGFETEPERFTNYLRRQAVFREFNGALILDDKGNVLLSTDPNTLKAYEPPGADRYEPAQSGEPSVELHDETLRFSVLIRLDAFDNAYLYAMRPINPRLMDALINSDRTLVEYREIETERQRLQIVFLLGFIQITALVLLFFVRYGIIAASQITKPIARLASAADEVRKGDLSVQVSMPRLDNEVSELTTSFNAMTSQLRQQRDEIDRGHREAIERSVFIEAVLHGVSAGIVRVDESLKVTLANPSACEMFPEFRSEGEPKLLPDVCREFGELALEAMESRSLRANTIVLNGESGQRHFFARAVPGDEDSPGCILTFDDTSGLITAQRQMAWRDVARRVAHEIRNPLTPIQLSAERLRRRYRQKIDDDDVVFDKCIDTIFRQVSDIGRMVEEFSSFARMPKPEVATFDFQALVGDCVFDARLSRPGVTYELDTADDPILMNGDGRLIGQALTNLLKNAGEAVERSKSETDAPRQPEVTTKIRHDETMVEVEIEDTGPGFPSDNRHHILEPYFTTREQGIGLGLAIVNRIVQDHGGQISLLDRHDQEQGARVVIRLPLSGPTSESVSNWTVSEEHIQ